MGNPRKTSRNYTQGLGGLGDASGLGLHHQDFLPKSLSTHEALFFRRYRRDISEAHFRAFWRQALPGMPEMLLQNAVNTVKNCCAERRVVFLSVLLLLWLARVLRGPCFFPVGFRAVWRARAKDPSLKTLLFTVFCSICVSGLACGLLFLGCSFWGLWRARATPCQPSGLGPGWGPESWHPRHHLGLGWATCIT